MKCRSVACIWSGTPTTHRVTAAAALSQPPTLYTGGSDGSILWWTLSSSESDSNLEIKPIAMLCGHAAPIADLGICYPTEVSGDGKAENPSNFMANSSLDNGALISACTDGVLCVWSRSSGHCRRRRRLPPWVGSPSTVCTLPSNPRYVCIGCCFLDAIKFSDHHSFDSVEGDEVSADKEVQNRKAPKCTVVIVDTYGLTIVRTVFHGNLAIGSMKFMAVVPSAEDRGKHSALVIDSFGRLQTVEISKEPESEGEGSTGLHKSPSLLNMSVWADGLVEKGQVVSVATSRNVIAFVLKDRCLFRLLGCGSSIGEISFVDNLFCHEGDSIHSHVMAGMFLESDDAHKSVNTKEAHKTFSKNFAVWNNRGSAIVYDISYMNKKFKCEPRCEIPAVSNPSNVRYSIYFVQMSLYLLRVESVCFHVEETLQWRPHVTGWSLVQKHGGRGKLCQHSRMVGKGFSFIEWITNSTLPSEIEGSGSDDIISTSRPNADPCAKNGYDKQADGERGSSVLKGKVVSSSMVISENFCAPYAIVYGFFSGEIEVLRFDLFDGLDCSGESPCLGVDSPVCRQYFSGHTAAVLCLAAHRMVGTAKGWNSNQLLVSGSMDCTIRIWDLSTGNLITVMHHHVAPVRQIIFSPPQTQHPWNNCFLSIGEDFCVALASLETLRVERIFPGHPDYPAKVVWDGPRGYIACLCRDHPRTADNNDVLYIWDVKTGAQERVLRGTASHSMFDHFCKGISMNSISGSVLNGNTSVSSLLLPMHEDGSISESHLYNYERGVTFSNITEPGTSQSHVSKGNLGKVYPHTPSIRQRRKQLIKCSSPYPGVAILSFDLASFMFPYQKHETASKESDKQEISSVNELETETPSCHKTLDNGSEVHKKSNESTEEHAWTTSLEEHMLRFSLSFLHLWNVDSELDKLLITDMKLKRPENFIVAAGLQGEKGSFTLTFPGLQAILELWKSSSEFGAMRSITMVSLAQRMLSLCNSSSAASSALAAFYTRNFAEKIPDIKPPLLQLLVSFWQDESEHVRMAARSLFHCAASRAIPLPIRSPKAPGDAKLVTSLSKTGENKNNISNTEASFTNGSDSDWSTETPGISPAEESKILAWIESYEVQDWISCVGGTSQDAMTSHIIVAAALSIWYPSLVKPALAMLVVHPLIKLVMATNEKYSSTAAELLAEGMESTWKTCIGSEIPHLIADIFFQIECVSGSSVNSAGVSPAVPASIRETLVGTLLPSLAVADILGFLTFVESQIWSTASDSPVHLVSLMTIIRVARGSPRNLVQYVEKVVNFILQTMDPGNAVMRRTCLQTSMTALKEVVRVFPMVALNDTLTKLAVGDAIGEIKNASIRVYDVQSVTKLKVLDASGPPGLPSLLAGASDTVVSTAISALSFSPDGEGLVAFSEHGLMIRWWSLGSVWWEKLSRNLAPVQCTKLIFVPPWEGFSPNSSRSSIMASVMGHDKEAKLQENARSLSYSDSLKSSIHNLDLSYRLEWVGQRKILLTRHGLEVGTFQL